MSPRDPLKTALDELRMLMLGTQVLVGFEFSALFQQAFETLDPTAKYSIGIALALLMIALALLIAPPCHHRLGKQGQRSARMLRIANKCANLALLPFALSLALNFFVVASRQFSTTSALMIGIAALAIALLSWYASGALIRIRVRPEDVQMANDPQQPALPARIEQMLTEARVILPGAQALLGFQFLTMLNPSFDALEQPVRYAHFAALGAIAVSMILLIAPAAVHRIGYGGQESEEFLGLASRLITVALAPLALGLALDLFVALMKLSDSMWLAIAGSALALSMFLTMWYAAPLRVRHVKASASHRRRTAI